MSKPIISSTVAGYSLHWADEKLNIVVSRLKEHSDGTVKGELKITTDAPGFNPHLYQAQFNFVSAQSRKSLAATLLEKYAAWSWSDILEQLSVIVLTNVRRGELTEDLDPDLDIKAPAYLLSPVIVEGESNLIYGEGGSGKSFLALLFSQIIQANWWDNPFDLIIPKNVKINTLYLDWETNSNIMAWRHQSILKGMGRPFFKLKYRRCSAPLADDLEQIQEVIDATKTGFVVIDSAGMAAGGDLNKSETATSFFKAIRKLKVTNLVISHTSKDQLTKKKTPFGSVYFFNESRSIWEVNHSVEEEGKLEVGMFHRKSNNSRLYHPIGFSFAFLEDLTMVESQDVRDIVGFMKHLKLATQIEALLKLGSLDKKRIAKELDAKPDSVRVTLYKMKKNQQVVELENDEWGLPTKLTEVL